jgi:hypothetical protein
MSELSKCLKSSATERIVHPDKKESRLHKVYTSVKHPRVQIYFFDNYDDLTLDYDYSDLEEDSLKNATN